MSASSGDPPQLADAVVGPSSTEARRIAAEARRRLFGDAVGGDDASSYLPRL